MPIVDPQNIEQERSRFERSLDLVSQGLGTLAEKKRAQEKEAEKRRVEAKRDKQIQDALDIKEREATFNRRTQTIKHATDTGTSIQEAAQRLGTQEAFPELGGGVGPTQPGMTPGILPDAQAAQLGGMPQAPMEGPSLLQPEERLMLGGEPAAQGGGIPDMVGGLPTASMQAGGPGIQVPPADIQQPARLGGPSDLFTKPLSKPGKPAKPPAGFRFAQDGRTLEAIPGGPAAMKREEAEKADVQKAQNVRAQSESALQNVGRALELVKEGAGGKADVFASGFTPWETATDKLQGRLQAVKALIGFKTLQDMREASKTGGALGQVSERELAFLQSVEGTLDAGKPELLKSNLKRIKNIFLNYRFGRGKGPERDVPEFDMVGRQITNPDNIRKLQGLAREGNKEAQSGLEQIGISY